MRTSSRAAALSSSGANTNHAERLAGWLSAPLLLLARSCLAFEFMLFGMRKFLHPEHVASMMSGQGIPGVLVWLVIPFQLVCGWLAALGLQNRIVSLALCAFCIVAPSIFHTHNLDNWSRDIASAGGWLLLALLGPGRWSLDARLGGPGRHIPAALDDGERLGVLMAVARVLIAVHFISCGVRDLVTEDPAAAQVGQVTLAMPIAALQIACGGLILLGWHARAACLVMAVYVFARANSVHSPAAELGLLRAGRSTSLFADQLLHSMGGMISSYGKDLAVFGATLALCLSGPGPVSLDARWSPRRLRAPR
jgi:putative oxidoreductase